MKKYFKLRALMLAIFALAVSGIFLLLINWRQRNIYVPLNELHARLVERINSGRVSGAYLLKVSGKCDLGDYGIFVPRIAGGNSLSSLTVSGLLWSKSVTVDKVPGNVAIITWPEFSSRVIKSSIDGVKTTKTSFESPEYALERLLVSEGFSAEASRENVSPLMTLASGMTAVYPENPISLKELKESGNLEGAMVKLLQHFGGIIIYAECRGAHKGIYDVQYLADGDRPRK